MKAFAEYIASAMYFAEAFLTESSKSPASIAKSNKQWVGTCLYQKELRSEADCEHPLDEDCYRKREV